MQLAVDTRESDAMDIKLHEAAARPGKNRHHGSSGWRAGIPVKRFFTRFRSLADVPPEDLDFLNERIRLALGISQEGNITALHTAVRSELRHRMTQQDDEEPDHREPAD